MPGLDVEDVYETDSSDNDEEKHSKLLSSVSQLDSAQRIKPAQRKEIASEVSEYNLNKGLPTGRNLINVKELVEVLGKKPEHGVITDKIKNITRKSKVLPKPLEKPVEERIKRAVGFRKVKEELRKWDAIVTRNALRDQIKFPLNDNSMKITKSKEFFSQFKTPTPLEVQIGQVLNQEIKENKDEEEEEFPLTLQEMMEKRREMAQLRARLSYSQTKAQRQSKIKSRKYHRLLKREKLKQQLKEFELLQKTDPEAALKKLAELDKTRATERASLRHRNTGKWAKNLAVRAKYDVETRKVLSDQLKMSRELTQKVSQQDSSEDEGTEEPVPPEKDISTQNKTKPSTDNPWMLDVSEEVQEFVSGYKKFWSEKGEEMSQKSEEKEKQVNNVTNKNIKPIEEISVDGETEEKPEPPARVESPEKKIIAEEEVNVTHENIKPIEETSVGGKTTGKLEPPAKFESPKKNKKRKTEKQVNEITNKNIQPIEEILVDDKKTEKSEPHSKVRSPKEKKISCKKVKVSPKKEKPCVSINGTSGVWIVTPVTDKPDSKKINKRKAEDIDTLFDELNEKLLSKATEKVKNITKKLKKVEKREKKFKKKKSEQEFDLSLKNKVVVERPDADVGLLEGGVDEDITQTPPVNLAVDNSKNETTPSIDPKNFIQVKPQRLNTFLPENVTGDEDGLDNEKAQKMIIEEAFEDDDVMAEFNEMKKEEEGKDKVEIETTLPGWGHWVGTGITPRKRKKRLLVLNRPPRKDKLRKDIIINENENPNLKNHLVKEVPHPFNSVEAFEANIRAPVGRDWVPESAHRKLIQKQVVTKLGTIIEPMSEEEIAKLKKASKSPYQGKKKKQENIKN